MKRKTLWLSLAAAALGVALAHGLIPLELYELLLDAAGLLPVDLLLVADQQSSDLLSSRPPLDLSPLSL